MMHNNRLFRKVENQLWLAVLKVVRWRVVKSCRGDAEHFSVGKTLLVR